MAAAQATGTQVQTNYTEVQWEWVKQLLATHLDRKSNTGLGSCGSPTSTIMERGASFSIGRPCPFCRSGKVRNGIVLLDCEKCYGSGQLLDQRKAAINTITRPCPVCHGARVYHPRKRRWDGIRPHELASCVKCRGEGHVVGLDAAPIHPADGLGANIDAVPPSWITKTLEVLDRESPKDALVLDVMFGGVGREVWKKRGQPRLVALYPLTDAGQTLIRLARRHFRRDIDTVVAELEHHNENWNRFREARIRSAEHDAFALLVRTREALFAADRQAEFRVLRSADALERKKRKTEEQRRERALLKRLENQTKQRTATR